jgi:Ca2+-transporting ATPase
MNIENPHAAEVESITGLTGTDCIAGLTSSEALNRQKLIGLNTIRSEKQEGIWKIFLVQFKSPMVLLLLAAAALSVYFSDYLDAIAILVVIAINALLGFYMEFQAVR